MANNRNRNLKNRCELCSKKLFVSLAATNETEVIAIHKLCSNHYETLIYCNTEKHQGNSHSTSCRYIKKAVA